MWILKEDIFLSYGEVDVEVPKVTMELTERSLSGVGFTTFPLKTIYYRYLIRGGLFKPKDFEKLDMYADFIQKNCDQEPNNNLYAPYIEFAMRVQEEYPQSVALFDAYNHFDKAVGCRISGSSGLVYKLIGFFRGK